MRLIDADALIEKIEAEWFDGYPMNDFREYVIKAPTIDAVPVVWCKDCKHYEAWEKDGDCYCTHFSADPYEYLPMEDDDFCSQGERSEE